jgi:tetratricopeptide (TPR) repeat protein
MSIDARQLTRVAKRVVEATGYLELDMAQQALDRLNELDDLGPFEAEVELLRGEALRLQQRFEDAAVALQKAARRFPTPFRKPALLALSLCYKQAGDQDRAMQSLAMARGALPAVKKG